MKNGWHSEKTLGNQNIPDGVDILGSLVSASGESSTAYYWLNSQVWKVGDWVDDKPCLAEKGELLKLGIGEE